MQHLQWEGWYNCSRSINTERGSAALVFTRKQKAIARTSVSFQQGGPCFRILVTFVCPAAYTGSVSTGPISLKKLSKQLFPEHRKYVVQSGEGGRQFAAS